MPKSLVVILANLHGRLLPEQLAITVPTASTDLAFAQATPLAATPEHPRAWACSPSSSEQAPEGDLQQKLTHLQTQVATLQEQVTQLALSVLQEREWRREERLRHPEATLPTEATTPVARRARPGSNESRLNDPAPKQAAADTSTTRPHARSRALPLIEYAADGRYLAICPTQGVLSLTPDSPEWFDWLASLTAFTFQGVNGRFSTTCKVRKGQRAHAWRLIALFMAAHAISISA